jgi:hypothetical protein
VLGAARDHAHRSVDYPDVGINAHRDREIGLAITPVAVKEKSIVKVTIAGKNLLHRLRGLMNWEVVARRDHRVCS